MTELELCKLLSDLPLHGVRFFEQVGSTNEVALAWAADGASDLSLVFADEQTHGRGRGDRHWYSPAGCSLSFSLVLRPTCGETASLGLFSALGALAVCEAVEALGLTPEIKWPNDVLLNQQKFCGILVEAIWVAEKVESMVLGIGVNIDPGSIPSKECLNFPATCLDVEAGRSIDRFSLFHEILKDLLFWRTRFSSVLFLSYWESHLAYRDQIVEVSGSTVEKRKGQVEGLEWDGSLRLRRLDGEKFMVQFGDVHLLPVV